jgi:hypothetical protein
MTTEETMAPPDPETGWRRFVAEANAALTGFPPAPLETTVAPTPLAGAFPGPPAFDPLELLPPSAADKLRALRQRRADAHALIPEFETVREASLARIEAENALKTLLAHPQEFGRNLKPDDPLVIAATKHRDKMADDFRRLQELQEVRSAAFQAAGAALAACED